MARKAVITLIVVGCVIGVLLGILSAVNYAFCSMKVKDESWQKIENERCELTKFLTSLIQDVIDSRKKSLT